MDCFPLPTVGPTPLSSERGKEALSERAPAAFIACCAGIRARTTLALRVSRSISSDTVSEGIFSVPTRRSGYHHTQPGINSTLVEPRGAVLTSTETLSRIARILARLAAAERPSSRELAGAPLASSWSIVAGADTYRIRAVTAMPPDIHERWRNVTLLALDDAAGWALVLAGEHVSWWVLGDPMPGGELPEDSAEIARRAAAWGSRNGGEGSRNGGEGSRQSGEGRPNGGTAHWRPR